MHAENFFAAFHVGPRNYDTAVKASGAQQRRIEYIRTVRRCNQDDAFVRFKAVHFDQECVQSLLALVVSAAQTCSAVASYGVDFIDEDNAGRILFALLEQIAHAARANAYKHFHEIGTGNREKGNVGLACDCASQQSFPCARRPDKQYALGNASAELLEFLRVFQKVDDFVKLFFRLIDSGDIFERCFLLLRG